MIGCMARGGVTIFVAVQMEANAIARTLGLTFRPDRRSATGICARDVPVELKIAGVGAGRLDGQTLPLDSQLVISAGLAGALDPSLACGDVVIDAQANGINLPRAPGVRFGTIHTSDTLVTTAAQKAALFQQTSALAVDMETAPLRRLAECHNTRFIAVRGISDRADEAIDAQIPSLLDPLGRPRATAVAGMLARRPWLLPQLLRLKANSDRALLSAASYLSQLLDSI
jgi:hypothetical protein